MLRLFVRRVSPVLMVVVTFFLIRNVALASSGTAKELDDVWTKLSDGVKGTYGKIASLGIVAASVWNRDKIGMLGMGAGIIVGVLIPTIPGILDKISTYTI